LNFCVIFFSSLNFWTFFFPHFDVDLFLSFLRYDQIDKGIQNHIMQHIILISWMEITLCLLKKFLFKNMKLMFMFLNFLLYFSIVVFYFIFWFHFFITSLWGPSFLLLTNFVEESTFLKHVMSRYDRGTSIDTFVGDHQFLNLTNCNITLTISNNFWFDSCC